MEGASDAHPTLCAWEVNLTCIMLSYWAYLVIPENSILSYPITPPGVVPKGGVWGPDNTASFTLAGRPFKKGAHTLRPIKCNQMKYSNYGLGLRSQESQVLMYTSYMALGKFPMCLEPQFAHAKWDSCSYLREVPRGLSWMRSGMTIGVIHPLMKHHT